MFLQSQKYIAGVPQACIIGANTCTFCSNELKKNMLHEKLQKTEMNQEI